jgi:MerR family copper efflux transcriptional regulator
MLEALDSVLRYGRHIRSMKDLTIARAARLAGVGVETIRFYERRGLIEQPPKPSGAGYRVYSSEQIKRIAFIRQAQQIGFSLHEIKELLSLRADPAADCSTVRNQAVAKLEEVKRKIKQLREIGSALEALIAVCPGRGGLQACTILDTLTDPTHTHTPAIGNDGPLLAVPPKRKRQTARSRASNREYGRA